MRSVAVAAVLIGLSAFAARWGGRASANGGANQVPVVVELFTSEGCSSCPPADAVLTRLLASQPVAGARVIGLSEHVDYWDSLGWKDPFSAALFSRRQEDYAQSLGRDGLYTPQIIVNGRREVLGSDLSAVSRAIAAAVHDTTTHVEISVASATGPDGIPVQIAISPIGAAHFDNDLIVTIGVTENDLTTAVKRGENGGRTLTHSGVVRTLQSAGTIAHTGSPWMATKSLRLDPGWVRTALNVVVFVSDSRTRRIVGAGSAPL